MAGPTAAENAERIRKIERTLDNIINRGADRARMLEDRIIDLERISESRGERIESLSRQIGGFENHLYRMENSLLNEFKISQEIMKSMLDHDLSIEKAKFDMKIELERREADLLNSQKNLELELKKQRAEMRRELMIKIGAVALPIATALATGITFYLEKFFN